MGNRSDSARDGESFRGRAGKGGHRNADGLGGGESCLDSVGGNVDGQKDGIRNDGAGDARRGGRGASERRGGWRRATAKVRPGWAGGVEGWTEDCLVEVSVKIVPSVGAREAVAPRSPTEVCAPAPSANAWKAVRDALDAWMLGLTPDPEGRGSREAFGLWGGASVRRWEDSGCVRLSILSGGQDGPDSVESVYDEAEEAVLAVDPKASVQSGCRTFTQGRPGEAAEGLFDAAGATAVFARRACFAWGAFHAGLCLMWRGALRTGLLSRGALLVRRGALHAGAPSHARAARV